MSSSDNHSKSTDIHKTKTWKEFDYKEYEKAVDKMTFSPPLLTEEEVFRGYEKVSHIRTKEGALDLDAIAKMYET